MGTSIMLCRLKTSHCPPYQCHRRLNKAPTLFVKVQDTVPRMNLGKVVIENRNKWEQARYYVNGLLSCKVGRDESRHRPLCALRFIAQPGDLFNQLLVTTTITSAVATALMGILANYPLLWRLAHGYLIVNYVNVTNNNLSGAARNIKIQ